MFVKPGKFAKAIVLLLGMLLCVALSPTPSFARGFRLGFRSFRGASRFHLPARGGSTLFSRGSSWGGGNRSAGFRTSARRGYSAYGNSSRFGSGRSAMSRADRALFERARSRGTAFSTRSEALRAFKTRNRGRFQNHFSSRPASRPTYIPRYTTGPNGSRYAVKYRPDLGGYGYYSPSMGRWMLYNVMGDAVMMNLLMHNQGYYYGGIPPSAAGGWGPSSTMGALLFLGLIAYAASRMLDIRRNF